MGERPPLSPAHPARGYNPAGKSSTPCTAVLAVRIAGDKEERGRQGVATRHVRVKEEGEEGTGGGGSGGSGGGGGGGGSRAQRLVQGTMVDTSPATVTAGVKP